MIFQKSPVSSERKGAVAKEGIRRTASGVRRPAKRTSSGKEKEAEKFATMISLLRNPGERWARANTNALLEHREIAFAIRSGDDTKKKTSLP